MGITTTNIQLELFLTKKTVLDSVICQERRQIGQSLMNAEKWRATDRYYDSYVACMLKERERKKKRKREREREKERLGHILDN